MQAWRDIATIVNKKGLNGGLVLQWRTGLSCVLSQDQDLFLVPPQTDIPRCVHLTTEMTVDSSKSVISFAEIADPAMVDAVIGCHVLVDAEGFQAFFPEESFGEQTFVGWTVFDKTLGEIGVVSSSEERYEQILLEVRMSSSFDNDSGSGNDVGSGFDNGSDNAFGSDNDPDAESEYKLIPLVEGILVEADADGRKLVLDCPRGLLEL